MTCEVNRLPPSLVFVYIQLDFRFSATFVQMLKNRQNSFPWRSITPYYKLFVLRAVVTKQT